MRASGILMHISSLPGKYGIGKLGREAYAFADFLKAAKQKYWQILPVSPTSYGDSPYQSFSCYAGNPYFIDFETLEQQGYLKADDYKHINWGKDPEKVDYSKLYENVFDVLRIAFESFIKQPESEFYDFINQNGWVRDYALFMALKFAHDGNPWYEWEEPLKMFWHDAIEGARWQYGHEIDFWCFVQYKYYEQWNKLKSYVNSLGIEIIGDIPIYVAYDSVEVWSSPQNFLLDDKKTPIDVAGCPPDAFTALGQLWGNPLYRWDLHEREGFYWWIDRIRHATRVYDVVRIDHFRGFESYYAIPFGREDATVGEWRKGPDIRLFEEVKRQLGDIKIIAEDLGFITNEVADLLRASGFPGMKVLEFAFDPYGKSSYLPHNYPSHNSVCYTGTHDNDTILGWTKNASKEEVKFCREYLGVRSNRDVVWGMIRLAWASVSDTAIAQMQDFLELGSEARMNTPSTLGGNWQWRCKENAYDDTLAEKIGRLTEIYDRQN
ncbi:MAG: 4-alpha-glucanotransferase [Ruminococcus sp.]|nr:4-alpha-glucanotransferase [Ruminococcus sp.]